jgi:cytochrome c-type biogenesis protein CcmH/NrfG
MQLSQTRNRMLAAAALCIAVSAVVSMSENSWFGARPAGPERPGNSRSDSASSQASRRAGTPVDEAVLALEMRLTREGGTDADWELLAQAYEFLGRADKARHARDGRLAVAQTLSESIHLTERLLGFPSAASVRQGPVSDATALLARAEDHRRQREFRKACETYEAVSALGAMTADAWADYADARGSLDGSLAGDAAGFIDRALALDPEQAKALWLKASLAQEQHRYDDALKLWRELLALIPPESSDAPIVEANIAEAVRLGRTGASG